MLFLCVFFLPGSLLPYRLIAGALSENEGRSGGRGEGAAGWAQGPLRPRPSGEPMATCFIEARGVATERSQCLRAGCEVVVVGFG